MLRIPATTLSTGNRSVRALPRHQYRAHAVHRGCRPNRLCVHLLVPVGHNVMAGSCRLPEAAHVLRAAKTSGSHRRSELPHIRRYSGSEYVRGKE